MYSAVIYLGLESNATASDLTYCSLYSSDLIVVDSHCALTTGDFQLQECE